MEEKRVKILMLGPGDPDDKNAGLGKAAKKISEFLSKQSYLSILQAQNDDELEAIDSEEENTIKRTVKKYRFTDVEVVSEMVKVSVKTSLNPYWNEQQEISSSKVNSSEIKREYEAYSDEILTKSPSAAFDIIYAHDWLSFRAAMMLKEKLKTPLVLHIHSLDYDRNCRKTNSWVFDLEQEAMTVADAIICVSGYTRNIIEEIYNIPSDKIEVVHNGFEKPNDSNETIPFKEKVVLFIGRLTGQKGPTKFLEIAEAVHKKNPNTRFIMAGDGDLHMHLLKAGAYSSILGKFHITGQVDNSQLSALYNMADVYCMPSVSEPFGLTALEAAASAVPVVLSRQSGASEVLSGALMADYDDTEQFVQHIDNLFNDEILSKQCISRNMTALKNISWQNANEQILEILKNQI